MFDNITVLRYTEEAQVTVSEVHCLSHLDQVKRSQDTGATFEENSDLLAIRETFFLFL